MTDWVRLWHDMPTDPKWRVIARKAGQPLPCVISLFTLMLTTASAADDRGDISSLTNEDAAAALDMDEEDVAAIREAMQGRVLQGNRLSGWERRQPKRERENDHSSQRVKEHRQRAKDAVTEVETPCNAMERHETPREDTDTDKIIPFSNENGRAPTSEKEFWDRAKSYLGGNNPGGMVGKWIKDFGRDETKRAITEAQAANAVDPIPYVQRVLRRAKATAESVPIC